MKYKVLLFFLLFLVSSRTAYAHVLKTDGSVGAVIHVSPEDDPIARESTDFFFEFKDKEGKFKPENCDCNGIILQGDKEIYSAPLFQSSTNPSLENASFSFEFPEKNIYKVRVSGKPTTPGAFEPFTLTWDIRVARESEVKPTGGSDQSSKVSDGNFATLLSENVLKIIGAILVISFIAFFIKKQLFQKKS